MKKITLLFLCAMCAVSTVFAAEPYGGLFAGKAGLVTAASEFITLRKTRDKLWMELPVRYLGREMLIGSTLKEISSEMFGTVGFKQQEPLYVRFALADTTLNVLKINSSFSTDYASGALSRVAGDPILFSYPVEAWGADKSSVVVDMTDLFLDNPPQFDFFRDAGISITPTPKPGSNSIEAIKAFADNASIETSLTFTASADEGGAQLADNAPVTARVIRSILLLPENKMRPRISDSRVGVFNTPKTRFRSPDEGSSTYSVAHRWRVEPSDPLAYERGERVEPKKKIVFYIDPAFPDDWKEPLRRAVERWNEPFEKIGFRNVLRALPFPTAEEDSAFDPDNLKYSCIRFLPSGTINAMGPSWVDPSTGEIVSASVIVWSDVAKLINRWRFVQTSQVDPRARNKTMPRDVFEESLEYVIAHEVGHTLGFAHSMASSSAWPVDSLRSVSFTRNHGTTPSIMDYARFNYIAQPGDVGVSLTPPKIGVYDDFLVRWAYRGVPGASDEWDEARTVESWVDAVAGNPVYRYGRQQFGTIYDPTALAEDLGDDHIKAGDYGVANLRHILPNLRQWISDDPDYAHRKSLYDEICGQYARYIGAVAANIGGMHLTKVKEGTRDHNITPVAKSVQRASLAWVMNQLRNMEWLDEPSLVRNFPLGALGAAQVRSRAAGELRGRIPCVVLSSHYARMEGAAGYTTAEFADDLFRETWRGGGARRKVSEGEKALQREMVDLFCSPLAAMKAAGGGADIADLRAGALKPTVGVFSSAGASTSFGPGGLEMQNPVDVAAIDDSADYLIDLAFRSRDLLERKVRRGGPAHAHYQALLVRLNAALRDFE